MHPVLWQVYNRLWGYHHHKMQPSNMASNHTRDSTGTRYHGKAPYNWPELRRLQEEEGERKRKARPKPPSGPDRCFVVNVDGVEKPPKPLQQMSFAFKEWDEARVRVLVCRTEIMGLHPQRRPRLVWSGKLLLKQLRLLVSWTYPENSEIWFIRRFAQS
jgi:hypothetical protein